MTWLEGDTETTTRVTYSIAEFSAHSDMIANTGGWDSAEVAFRTLEEHPEMFGRIGEPMVVETTLVETRTVTRKVVARS